MKESQNGKADYDFTGTIRKDPVEKDEIVVAAFTGNHDFGFPHNEIVDHVRTFDPDLLVFTGDQLYEACGGYGIQRSPVPTATLDYLRKWFIYGWAFRDLARDRPAVCLPDDHDVYQGNIWGAGGRHAEGFGPAGQDQGGYTMDARWVTMVHRTQTSHMPDPWDPTPVEQNIPVYYTAMRYGGVSFALIEDRKWKSAPKVVLPEARIVNGWAQNPDYNAAADGDAPGALLLGPRQLDFLEQWGADWSRGTWMKCVLSQSIFSNVATLPKAARSDGVTKGLQIMAPGQYAEAEKIVMDHDSNGWPQTGRNQALRVMRRARALHIAGDQHLGSTIHYGVEDWNDAGFAICVPSIANIFPRRWFPPQPGRDRKPGSPRYTGEFEDGFGNKMTVHAVSNPRSHGIEPTALNHRAPGYGIIRFHRRSRKITLSNWPRWVDPSRPGAKPYDGWPIVIDQADNDGRKAYGYLPTIEVSGMEDPVVEVIDESSGERLYTLRIRGRRFRPKVFEDGFYTLKVGEPGAGGMKQWNHLQPVEDGRVKTLHADLSPDSSDE